MSSSDGPIGSLHSLLYALNVNVHEAALIYERLRRVLDHFFTNRGCGADSDALADIVLERLAVRISESAGASDKKEQSTDSVFRFAFGIAGNVAKEHFRHSARSAPLADPGKLPSREADLERELRSICLNRCQLTLSVEERDLITRYYSADGQKKINERQKMADELNITLKALRVRVWNVRQKLRKCIEKCMKAHDAGLMKRGGSA